MSNSDHTDVLVYGGTFVDYPSKAGGLFKWAGPSGQERWAWHPTKATVSGYGIASSDNVKAWIPGTFETCPSGYRRPKAAGLSATTTSEFAMSLLSDPTTSNRENSVWGYYADGFFDRRPIETSNTGRANTVVNNNSYDAAYIGQLFFNDISGSQREGASIFFPAPGSRHRDGGALDFAGVYGFYISSSYGSVDVVYDFQIHKTDVNYYHDGYVRSRGVSIRCVVGNYK
jgi:hypothetical protein